MIFIFSEDNETAFEILSKARAIAKDTELVSILIGNKDRAETDIAHGADRVFFTGPSGNSELLADMVVCSIIAILEQHKPETLLIGGTKLGKEVAPRIAQRLGVGCATDCIDLSLDDGQLKIKRLVLGGRFIATQKFLQGRGPPLPRIATMLPRSFEKKADKARKGEIIEIPLEPSEPGVQVLERKKKAPQEVRIEEADIIVSIGRGLKKKEDLRLISELAEVLGGALGCSRSIAADLKWLSEDHWVGLSGHKVKPKLYIAIGVSGQVQHIAGIRDAKTIIAINSDPNAPIFKACDYGIVGDLYKIVPELIKTLKEQG